MNRKKVLVIEDDPLNMELVTDLLTVAGYAVFQAITAEEGLEIAKKEKPALILMDARLPGMDGLKATRILKQGHQTKDIPVVALTASAMTGDKAKCLAAGCAGYLAEPIDTRNFSKAVAAFIDASASDK